MYVRNRIYGILKYSFSTQINNLKGNDFRALRDASVKERLKIFKCFYFIVTKEDILFVLNGPPTCEPVLGLASTASLCSTYHNSIIATNTV